MFQHRCCDHYSMHDLRIRDELLRKLGSQLFVAQRQRNKALCIQLQKEIKMLG